MRGFIFSCNFYFVFDTKVVTEEKLLQRSKKLQDALVTDEQCLEYCKEKLATASNEMDVDIWNFLLVSPRCFYLLLVSKISNI